MKPSQIIRELKIAYDLREPVYLQGPPGGGKTSVVKQVTKELGIGMAFIHAPTANSEDIGCPSIMGEDDWLRWKLTDQLPFEGNDDFPDHGIIVVDELPQAAKDVQNVIGNLLLERNVHGRKIKDGWSFLATGNRASDRAGANRLLSHVLGRLTVIDFETDLNDFCAWGIDTGKIVPEVLSFVRFKPGMLHDFDAQRDQNPTPRGWEKVSKYTGKISADSEYEFFKGVVGEGAAAEYTGFLKIFRKLPNPDIVLMNPDKHEVPTEPSVCYALCGALAARSSADNFDNVLTFVRRMSPEFTVLTVLDATRRDPNIQDTKAFLGWAATDGAKILI